MPKLDLNLPRLHQDLLILEKEDLSKVMSTLRKLIHMDWSQVYKDKGLNWEFIKTTNTYTIRASKKIRIVVLRVENDLCLLSIHTDHDSAYE